MLLGGIVFILGQIAGNEVSFDQPIETLKADFSVEYSEWGFEEIPVTSSLAEVSSQISEPKALFLKESLLLPARKNNGRYGFSLGMEVNPLKPVEDFSADDWIEYELSQSGVCELVLSDVYEIFLPPYVVSARAVEIEKVEWLSKETHQIVIFKLKDNNSFKELKCYLPLRAEFDRILEALPSFLSIVNRKDLTKNLPAEKNAKTISDFDLVNQLKARDSYFRNFEGPQENIDLKDFLSAPRYRSYRGYDPWGNYYEESETSFEVNGSVQFRFRTYYRHR